MVQEYLSVASTGTDFHSSQPHGHKSDNEASQQKEKASNSYPENIHGCRTY
ncbi:MAG: hypothetical protein ABW032_02770 [Burkholderiaceae bacterium]